MATEFAEEVFRIRKEHAAVFPSRQRIHRFVEELVDLLFPSPVGRERVFRRGGDRRRAVGAGPRPEGDAALPFRQDAARGGRGLRGVLRRTAYGIYQQAVARRRGASTSAIRHRRASTR